MKVPLKIILALCIQTARTGLPDFGSWLYGHLGLYVRMRIVVLNRKILITESKYVLHRGVQSDRRQGSRGSRQLQACLLQMIEIKVRIAERMDEVTGSVAGDLRHHHCEQRI